MSGEIPPELENLSNLQILHIFEEIALDAYVLESGKNPKGKYLSVCFSEKDETFETSDKYRKTSIGTILYFSSESELRELFSPYFDIIEMKTLEIKGKSTPHIFNYAFMIKK